MAATISDEEIKAIEVDRLTDRLVIQNQLLQQTVSRLSKLPQHSPFSGRLISVINPPSPGSQVSPVLRPILQTSIGSGLLAGLGLFVLVYVASLVTTDPEVGQDRILVTTRRFGIIRIIDPSALNCSSSAGEIIRPELLQ